ncbi:Spy/CpxP family protein refolding chaperone [uncultured Muribaculum sp.]|uniref:Spy/CpxP family protein refolding chaperone n=1 Tax=uncultured Muribaculum sp. TaxID=1918613 RepID=UPI0025DB48F3|nr:Spy/CpxP family protein refolding chaperone [uncultured Muribaculum sp.]
MNKKVLSAMVLCASLFTLSASAQNPKARNQACPQQQCPVEAKCDNFRQQCAPAQCCTMLFEGITLTDAQKSKIQDLQKAQMEKRTAKARETKDAAKAEKRKMREERDSARKADRRAYLDGVKQVLTPEQYVIFLENAYMTPAPQGPRAAVPGRMHHGMKQGAKPNQGKESFGRERAKDGKIVRAKATEVKAAN